LPPTVTSVLALIVVVPTVAEVMSTEQEPVPPEVMQLFTPPTNVPGPKTIEKSIVVPFGASAKLPEPVFAFTWPVSVWFVLSAFVAVNGEIWMFASTNVFTASSLFNAWPSVSTVKVVDGKPSVSDADACPVTLPAVGELKVIVH